MKGGARADKLALLVDELARAQQAAAHFEWSVRRCEPLSAATPWSAEDLERLESMASRFARLSDLLTQRLMRLADDLELESAGSLLDRLRRAEKRGWVDHDGELVRIRELRNLVAHEYEDEDLVALYREILRLAPTLLDCVQRITAWSTLLR